MILHIVKQLFQCELHTTPPAKLHLCKTNGISGISWVQPGRLLPPSSQQPCEVSESQEQIGFFPSRFLGHSFCFKNPPNITSKWGTIWCILLLTGPCRWTSALALPLSVLISVVIQTNADSYRGTIQQSQHLSRRERFEDTNTSWCLQLLQQFDVALLCLQ